MQIYNNICSLYGLSFSVADIPTELGYFFLIDDKLIQDSKCGLKFDDLTAMKPLETITTAFTWILSILQIFFRSVDCSIDEVNEMVKKIIVPGHNAKSVQEFVANLVKGTLYTLGFSVFI